MGVGSALEHPPMSDILVSRLKSIRDYFGFSQRKASIAVGQSPTVWATYESGKSMMGGEALTQLCSLGVNINWLLTGDGEMLTTEELGFGLGEFDEDLFITTVVDMEAFMEQAGVTELDPKKRALAYLASYKAVMRDRKNRAEWTGEGERQIDEAIFKDIDAIID